MVEKLLPLNEINLFLLLEYFNFTKKNIFIKGRTN